MRLYRFRFLFRIPISRFLLCFPFSVSCLAIPSPSVSSSIFSGPASCGGASTSKSAGRLRNSRTDPPVPINGFVHDCGAYLDLQRFAAMGMNGDSGSALTSRSGAISMLLWVTARKDGGSGVVLYPYLSFRFAWCRHSVRTLIREGQVRKGASATLCCHEGASMVQHSPSQ